MCGEIKLCVTCTKLRLHSYADMSMMTTLCVKAVGQLSDGIKARNAHIFSEQGSA